MRLAKEVIAEVRVARVVMQVQVPSLAMQIDQNEFDVIPWNGLDSERLTDTQRHRLFALNDQVAAILGVQAEDVAGLGRSDDDGAHDPHRLFVVWLNVGWVVVVRALSLQAGILVAQSLHAPAVSLRCWNLGAALIHRAVPA